MNTVHGGGGVDIKETIERNPCHRFKDSIFLVFASLNPAIRHWKCTFDNPMKNILDSSPVLEELCLHDVAQLNFEDSYSKGIELNQLTVLTSANIRFFGFDHVCSSCSSCSAKKSDQFDLRNIDGDHVLFFGATRNLGRLYCREMKVVTREGEGEVGDEDHEMMGL
ncbi:hypothetical protein L2E82_14525 [Cichorium intybus]|uniref:Uncharacterized protein n=1 Tax=Cichorium intybus TaxID=13427 RepID=A0ACB9F0P1_CICIN|nr:hypothetical protein L2E82_14525 [Cichorium intybus]